MSLMIGCGTAGDAPCDETDYQDVVDIFSDSSVVAMYKFEGNYTDETGTYDGTVHQGTPVYKAGRFGQCIDFTSSTSFKAVIPPEMKTPNWSLSIHVYWDGVSQIGLFSDWITDSNPLYSSFANRIETSGAILWRNYNGTEHSWSPAGRCVPGWNHIVFEANNGFKALWLNGLYELSITPYAWTNASMSNGGTYVYYGYGYLYNLATELDQVRVFNRVLTANEVEILQTESVCTE